jgi:hypothetical protein
MAVLPAIFDVTTPIPSTLLELEAAARPEGQLAQCPVPPPRRAPGCCAAPLRLYAVDSRTQIEGGALQG